jgi:hypothetical protein
VADKTVYHVTKDNDAWQVKKEGSERASSRHDDKAAAVAAGKQFAQNKRPGRVVVHKADGTIQDGHNFEVGGEDGTPTQGILARLRGWLPI